MGRHKFEDIATAINCTTISMFEIARQRDTCAIRQAVIEWYG